MPFRFHPAARIMASALIVAAPPALAAATPTDACAVLTSAQVTSAVGTSVGAGTYVTPTFTQTCTWTASGMIVTLNIQSMTMFNAGKGAIASAENTPASGVGDEAYYFGAGSTVSLIVSKNGAAFKVSVYSSKLSLDQRKAAEMTLAQQAASKF